MACNAFAKCKAASLTGRQLFNLQLTEEKNHYTLATGTYVLSNMLSLARYLAFPQAFGILSESAVGNSACVQSGVGFFPPLVLFLGTYVQWINPTACLCTAGLSC